MKRYIIISMILVSMVLCVALVHAEPGPKVLLIPREGHSGDLELMLTKEDNPQARFEASRCKSR
jgi:hypothetical protein